MSVLRFQPQLPCLSPYGEKHLTQEYGIKDLYVKLVPVGVGPDTDAVAVSGKGHNSPHGHKLSNRQTGFVERPGCCKNPCATTQALI